MSGRRREDLWDLFPGDNHYSVTYSIVSACTTPRLDPSEYTETIRGKVVNVTEEGGEEPIGKFEGYRLRRDWAWEEGFSFFEIADGFSSETRDYLLKIFEENGEVRPEITEALGGEEPHWGPVLMAHTLEIEPAHRGRGLGYAIINSFIETFEPGVGVVIAHAAPINPPELRPGETDTPEYRLRRARGVRRLRRYWEGFGFVAVSPNSEYLAMNLAFTRPSVVDAIRAMRSRKRRRATRRRPPRAASPNTGRTR